MSSTTESSDWNLSPKSQGPHGHLHAMDDGPPTSPNVNHVPNIEHSSGLPVPRADAISLPTTVPPVTDQSIPSNLNPEPPTQVHTPIARLNTGDASHIDQNTPEWEAARESVLSNMVTSQDIAATIPSSAGRAGLKTGGRRGRGHGRPRIKVEAPSGEQPSTPGSARGRTVNRGGRPRGSRAGGTSARGINRGGRPRGSRAGVSSANSTRTIKKRRKNARITTDDEKDDGSSEEVTNLPTQSRSGRRITQANNFSPVVLDPETPTGILKRPSNLTNAAAQDYLQPPQTRKRKRAPGATAVCINCGRGHSPSSNMIVFCDTCNTPYHQHCHDRPITPSVVQIKEKEWNCAECEVLAQERVHMAGKVAAAEGTSLVDKRKYFQGLEKGVLVAMLLKATSLLPDLPVFDPPDTAAAVVAVAAYPTPTTTPAVAAAVPHLESQAQQSSSPVSHQSHPSSTLNPPPQPPPPTTAAANDDPTTFPYGEIYVEPEEPLPYPKPGNGLVLPPEEDDLAFLIDEDVVTYSHSWVEGGGRWVGALGEGGGGLAGGGVGDGGFGFEVGIGMEVGGRRVEVGVGA